MEGISESEEIDRRVEELMAPEEEGNGKKKKKSKSKRPTPVFGGGFHPVRRFKGFSRKRKIITVLVLAAVVLFGVLPYVRRKEGAGDPGCRDASCQTGRSGKAYGKRSCIRHRQRGCGVQYSCEITAMNVKEGDTVTKGQVLAVVDSTDLEREVQIAQNAYDLAVANKQEKR